MLPGNTASTLLSQYLRGQQGVLEAVKLAPDDIRLTVGEKVQATVTNQLPNGRFAVLVKDQLLDLNLPRNTQPGEKLDLTVVSKSPTLTFSLALQDAKPTLAQGPNVALSKGAMLLSEVLSKPSDGKAAVLQQAQPLFSGKPDTGQLAGQLAGRLTESGLFYESHQAEWVSGQRPLQSLLREPQALLNLPIADEAQDGKTPAATKDGTSSVLGKAEATATSVKEGQASTAFKEATSPELLHKDGMQSVVPKDGKELIETKINLAANKAQEQIQQAVAKKADDIPPEQAMRQLVRQQVDLLEQRPLIWQGNAWPGQPLQWQLELQNEQEQQAELPTEQRQWQTKLELTLPKLGALGVVATMVQGQFSLRFNAVDEKTVSLIQTHRVDLMQRFEAAGLTLVKSQVDHEGA